MRLWHIDLLPYLPDLQFKAQLSELGRAMRDWRDKGATNHLLINFVMLYPTSHLCHYFDVYSAEYLKRYGRPVRQAIVDEFEEFDDRCPIRHKVFHGHMDDGYLDICMCNLWEKHAYGIGPSKISCKDWEVLEEGYFEVTGHPFRLPGERS